jgi:hypothetical protein
MPRGDATAVLDAVAREHLPAVPAPGPAVPAGAYAAGEPPAGLRAAADLAGPARALLVLAMTATRHPGLLRQPEFRTWLAAVRAEGAAYLPGSRPAGAGVRPGRDEPRRTDGMPAAFAPEPGASAGLAERSASSAEVSPLSRPRHRLDDFAAGRPAHWPQPPWEDGGPQAATELATALYAVNLVERLGLDAVAGPTSTGWAVVEAVIRWLLRNLPARRRARLLADPLLCLLGELDGRPSGVPSPVRPGPWIRRVDDFLTSHDLDVTTFTRPGRIVVSRTHVDIVLTLDQIDLAVRVCGLDQDPGWVPHLGRVVLFHFGDPAWR